MKYPITSVTHNRNVQIHQPFLQLGTVSIKRAVMAVKIISEVFILHVFNIVRITGFEPATSSSQMKRATGLRYILKKKGAP